jgi:hypothetical protein
MEPLSKIVHSALQDITRAKLSTLPHVAITALLDDFLYAWLKAFNIPYNFEMLEIARSLFTGQNELLFKATHTKSVKDIRDNFSKYIKKWHQNDNRAILSLGFDGKKINVEWVDRENYLESSEENQDDVNDLILTQHAIYQMMNSAVISCPCGGYRKIVQKKDPPELVTECPKCKAQDPFNLADLTVLGGSLLKMALSKTCKIRLSPPDVASEDIFQMIEDLQDHEEWAKTVERQYRKGRLKVLPGGFQK